MQSVVCVPNLARFIAIVLVALTKQRETYSSPHEKGL